ncbi:MAG: 4'-phosphopantetheinyl transferase superfamily protein [Arthrobacter sp.]
MALRSFAAGILGAHPGELAAAYSCPDCGSGPDIDHGRPGYRLHGAAAGLILSLSRSCGWALLAAGVPGNPGTAVGIDLEHRSGIGFEGFDDVALTPAERQLLAAVPAGRASLWRAAAWTRKEALLKARGSGLRVDPASVNVFAESVNGTVLVGLDTVALGLPAGFVAALAVLGGA